jgi:ABC-2 type transport system permease protein
VSAGAAQPWGALWYLYTRSWRNRLLQQLRRLKQPRYIIGVLAMGAYFASLAYSASPSAVVNTDPTLLDVRQLLSILGLSLALGAWWLAAPSDNALAFGSAEVYFLFPAPVKRRTLVQARLFSVQAVLLMQVLIWTLLLRRSSGDLHAALRALGLWVLFTTISLHRLGATLARTHAPDVPRRKPVAKTIAVAFLVLLVVAAARAAPQAIAMWRSFLDLSSYDNSHVVDRVLAGRVAVQALLNDSLVHILIWPIRAITGPAFAQNGMAWLLSVPGALLVLGVHYFWILRDPQPFEELALGSSARFADRVARVRRGGSFAGIRRTPLRWTLGLHGNPAVALAWKNVTAVTRTFRPRALIVTVLIILVIAVISTRGEGGLDLDRASLRSAFITTLTGVFAAAVLTAPAWFRLDLRHDLTHLAFLKTAPLAAHTIVATEILTAATITTLAMTVLFAGPAFFLMRGIGGPLGTSGLALAVLGACVALAGINLLHITLYNAVALWLPAWVPLNQGGAATGGASVVGQVYITLIGILVSLALLLAVPVGAGWGLFSLLLPARLPVAATAALALALAMALIVLEWLALARLLGRALDRLEPSDIPATQS